MNDTFDTPTMREIRPKGHEAESRLTAIYEAARAFIATTSVFRQGKDSRDSFEELALLVLAERLERGDV